MPRRSRLGAAVAIGSIAAVAALPATGALAAATVNPPVAPLGAPLGEPGAAPPVAVTLITGDTAYVSTDAQGRSSAMIRSAEGATTGDYVTRQLGDDLYVLPMSVGDALADHRLDQELFNVTSLIRQGYDDASTKELPLIVSGAVPRSSDGVTVGARLESVGGAAVSVAKEDAASALDSLLAGGGGKTSLWLDELVQPTGDLDPATGVEQTGAPTAWTGGLDGDGVTVAVLDTGWDGKHPDLVNRVVDAKDFTGVGTTKDSTGHGTHVAGTVAGDGSADARRTGMAPGADLLVGKVLGPNGGAESWIVAGMEWAVEKGADVVNMSLGATSTSGCTDPIATSLQALGDDALFVVAAGNSGQRETVSTPGCAPKALTVGAVDSDGATAGFSSRGSTLGNHGIKPDIAAPGVGTVSAANGSPGGVNYVAMSGTSMASPHVAGGAALVAQAHPEWSPQQLKAALTASVKDSTDATVYEQGSGELWVPGAVGATVTSDVSVHLADFDWPHGADERVTKDVTYTNTTDAPVKLSLRVTDPQGAEGASVPSSMIRLGATTVTVPAHGTVAVPVSARGDVGNLDEGAYGEIGARIVAEGTVKGTKHRVVTAVGLWLEPESVDVTFTVLDRAGEKATRGTLDVTDAHQPSRAVHSLAGADTTLRMRTGEHVVTAFVRTTGADGTSWSYVGLPQLEVTADTTHITLDARDATPVTVEADQPLRIGSGVLATSRSWDRWGLFSGIATQDAALFAAPTDRVRHGDFAFATYVRGYAPGVPAEQSDYVYNLGFVEDHMVSRTHDHRVTARDLASVTEHWFSQSAPWPTAADLVLAVPSGGDPVAVGLFTRVGAPTERTAYYSAGMPWRQAATGGLPPGGRGYAETWFDPIRTYAAGETRQLDWLKLPTQTAMAVRTDGTSARIAERQGSLVGFAFPHWQDTEPGRYGEPGFFDVGNLRLSVDGVAKNASSFPSGQWDIGAGEHELTATITQFRRERQGQWQIGRLTETSFTFQSAQPEGEAVAALPVAVPTYDAPVDELNLAAREADFPVTIGLKGQDGYDPKGWSSLTAKIGRVPFDFNAGKLPDLYTDWVDVPVEQRDGQWVALVDNSALASGFKVMLAIDGVDGGGTRVQQYVADLYVVG